MFVPLVLLIACGRDSSASSPASTAIEPFGFPLGGIMSESMIEAGDCLPTGSAYACPSAPKPVPEMTAYAFFRVSDGRVAKVVAMTEMNPDPDGEKVRAIYGRLKALLADKYGPATVEVDKIKDGAVWGSQPDFYAMALKEGERGLFAIWNADGGVSINLEAVSGDGVTTFVRVTYEQVTLAKQLDEESRSAGKDAL